MLEDFYGMRDAHTYQFHTYEKGYKIPFKIQNEFKTRPLPHDDFSKSEYWTSPVLKSSVCMYIDT
jgi:hypothetical protein